MSVVIIPYDELLKSPVVPIQARTYVTDEQYVQIHQRFAVSCLIEAFVIWINIL